MVDDDFNIQTLADYLHVDPAQVDRLVERGKVPGRKVAGQWRFARAEIHHWLEERIGLSNDQELAQMEGALRRAAGDRHQQPLSIAELLPVEAIGVPLAARTRGSAISGMVELAANTGWLWDTAKMAEAVRQREELAPTAWDNGLALLHPRRPMPQLLGQAFLAFGRVEAGIPFGAPRGVLTDLFFLILSTDDRVHLQVLARLGRLLSDQRFLDALRQTPDAAATHQLFVERESGID